MCLSLVGVSPQFQEESVRRVITESKGKHTSNSKMSRGGEEGVQWYMVEMCVGNGRSAVGAKLVG